MLRFGLVGTGFWAGAIHAPGIAAHPQTELVGVWGRDPAKAESLAAQFGARPYADVDELIGAVDAVAFAVPPDIQGELALRAAAAGRALLLEKPLALTVEAAERIVEAARQPTVVFFTSFGAAEWLADIEPRDWDGGSVTWLASILDPDNPFGASPWRHEHGALWDLGPHALALLLPVLGPVTRVEAVRGRGDEVHLVLEHASGAASTAILSLTSPAGLTEVLFWGGDGVSRMPAGDDSTVAYARALDALLAGETRFDAQFGLEVVRVLAAAEERLAGS